MTTTPTPSNSRFYDSTPSAPVYSGVVAQSVNLPDAVSNKQRSSKAAAAVALLKEPADASLTGGTRTLDRRLLALNLSGAVARSGMVR